MSSFRNLPQGSILFKDSKLAYVGGTYGFYISVPSGQLEFRSLANLVAQTPSLPPSLQGLTNIVFQEINTPTLVDLNAVIDLNYPSTYLELECNSFCEIRFIHNATLVGHTLTISVKQNLTEAFILSQLNNTGALNLSDFDSLGELHINEPSPVDSVNIDYGGFDRKVLTFVCTNNRWELVNVLYLGTPTTISSIEYFNHKKSRTNAVFYDFNITGGFFGLAQVDVEFSQDIAGPYTSVVSTNTFYNGINTIEAVYTGTTTGYVRLVATDILGLKTVVGGPISQLINDNADSASWIPYIYDSSKGEITVEHLPATGVPFSNVILQVCVPAPPGTYNIINESPGIVLSPTSFKVTGVYFSAGTFIRILAIPATGTNYAVALDFTDVSLL